jgi:hypothetical protein
MFAGGRDTAHCVESDGSGTVFVNAQVAVQALGENDVAEITCFGLTNSASVRIERSWASANGPSPGVVRAVDLDTSSHFRADFSYISGYPHHAIWVNDTGSGVRILYSKVNGSVSEGVGAPLDIHCYGAFYSDLDGKYHALDGICQPVPI